MTAKEILRPLLHHIKQFDVPDYLAHVITLEDALKAMEQYASIRERKAFEAAREEVRTPRKWFTDVANKYETFESYQQSITGK